MCDNCDWEHYLARSEEILEEKETPLMLGIYNWIDEHHHVTIKQADTIDDIYNEMNSTTN